MTKLLNIDANPKTIKGQKQGYMTAILYLAPASMSGFNVCPMAKMAGCIAGCLNTAGHGGISKAGATFPTPNGPVPDNQVQRARIARTKLYFEDRPGFFAQLIIEIRAFIRRANRKGLTPVVRLNGTSDIPWESIEYCGKTIFAWFPEIQFYDYTKTLNRRDIPANYYLSISYSQANQIYARQSIAAAADQDRNLVVVFRKALPETFNGRPVISGDDSDLRFLDQAGVIIGLKAKGKARADDSGFVIDADQAPAFPPIQIGVAA